MTGGSFWKLGELPELLRVRPLPACHQVDKGLALTGVSTDSRTLQPGELFVALEGENFDGHAFIDAAIENGAPAVVVNRDCPDLLQLAQRHSRVLFLPVADTLETLGELARIRLRSVDPVVFSITGSNGKTTTKEMLALMLESRYRVHKTAGNFNNRIGLPLTIFAMPDDCEALILEMGMNEPGELTRLSAIARADYLLLTNVAAAHLQGLGSLEAVARAKCEALSGLKPGATVVYNVDDPQLREKVPETVESLQSNGFQLVAVTAHGAFCTDSPETALISETWLLAEGLSFVFNYRGESTTFKLGCWGRHNVMNAALAAAAATRIEGLDGAGAARALRRFTTPPGRLELHRLKGGGILVHDAYNANPDSMEAALTEVAGRRGRNFLGLVLGDMNELGEQSDLLHRRVGGRVAEMRPDLVVLIGQRAATIGEAAAAAGLPPQRIFTLPAKAWEAAVELLLKHLPGSFLLLVKGSRSLRLEKVVEPLRAHFGVVS